MAEAAVTFLIEKITEVPKWHKDLISGSEDEFRQLQNDLDTLKEFLREEGNKSKKEEVFRDMERQIREVVYDVEDAIDLCLTKAVTSKSKSSIRRHLSSSRISLAKEVKSLREDKLRPLLDKVRAISFSTLGVSHGVGTSVDEPPSRPVKDQSIRRDNIVGFEDEEAKLISYLMEDTEKLDVISIIGMPGLGKTTLAWKIFENEKICYEFPVRIWVHASQRFSSRDVFLKILRKFTSNDMSGQRDEELAKSVSACLAKEKFLLVMDDVWSTDDWKAIRDVLPNKNGFSKVMITSRDKSVGAYANDRRDPHMLRFFKQEESWNLLQLEVFGDAQDCPPELKAIGELIAQQCDGVPLVVVTVGGILVDLFMKTQAIPVLIKEWENVCQNVSKFMQNDKEKRIIDVVELSYNRLPDYLRECFLYTAVFPEEYIISAWTLKRMWIAEGFIQHEEGKTLEEIAEENLDDLISRNLLMVDSINPMGKIKSCRVQAMIHAFCRLKAVEQNLFQEIKKSKEGVSQSPVYEVPKSARLCFHSDFTNFLAQNPNGEPTRSILCFYKEPVVLDPKYISSIPDAFILLRVLESKSIKFHQFPAKINKLIHLKYITLNIDDLALLPDALTQLWNLQTLVVETKSPSLLMKANIWRMYRLRSLKTKAAIVLDRKGEGEGGENLLTVSRLSPESVTADVPERARNLKTLGIRGKLAAFLSENMSLNKFAYLEKLKLVNDLPDKTGAESPPIRLPQPKWFPPNLKRLTLSNTFLEWSQMSTLAKINNLEVLKLKDNAFAGVYWSATKDSFTSLQLLLITEADLVLWEVSTSSFPQLQCLVLHNCENLNEIPEALAGTLQKLDVNRLGKSAVESARRIEQEKVKLRVPFRLTIGS